jgi:phage/plasmid-like protein (TIGR03299 family)
MSAEFSSGIFLRGEAAWHGEGEVTNERLTAAEAFERANALFPVAKQKLWLGNKEDHEHLIHVPGKAGIYRTDTNEVLGVVNKGYPIYPNNLLLRFAEGIESQADIDAVVVLSAGRKVAFTSMIKDAAGDVLPGDSIAPFVAGFLGHDGKTSLSGAFTYTRVVCRNTLQMVMDEVNAAGNPSGSFRFPHINGFESDEEAIAWVTSQLDQILAGIDVQRRIFPEVLTTYRQMPRVDMSQIEFTNFVRMVYQVPETITIDGVERPVTLEMAMPRKWAQLQEAFVRGIGMDIDGVAGSLWAGFNAITQIETSADPRAGRGSVHRRLQSTYFGAANNIVRVAHGLAVARLGVTAGQFTALPTP